MGLFESLGFGKPLAEGELLHALGTARKEGDVRRFTKLCHKHVDVIIAAAPRWQKPPPEVTANPAALNDYMQTLSMAAELLRAAGHPELLQILVGDPDSNPISVWERKLKEANALANEDRFDEAAELLMNHLIDTRQLRGDTVNHLQALSQGSLGHIRFRSGKVDLALGHYEQALRSCRERKDIEGIRVYLGNLYQSQRYLGNPGPAADYAHELGQAWHAAGNLTHAKHFSRLSQIVRAGEPLLRMVAHCGEQVMELDEVEFKPSLHIEFHFWRNRPSIPASSKLIERGKTLASKRQYDEALELFREAAKIDPYDPDSHYQAGMVFCEQRLYPQAVDEYENCETLAPGWYFCRSDLWVAKQLTLGAMSHEVFLALRFLQDGPPDPKARMKLANEVRSHAGAVPLFALLYGLLLQETGRRGEAAQIWREALAGDVEPDVRSRMLVNLSAHEKDDVRRRQLLQETVELNGNLMATAGAMLSLRFGK